MTNHEFITAVDVERFRPDHEFWRPVIFDAATEIAMAAVQELLRSGDVAFVHDDIVAQLRELISVRQPKRRWSTAELDAAVGFHLGERHPQRYGTWVYYPWSRRLVHLLPRSEFREVRTDRNRYKICPEEQARLASFHIGVVGLSVGNAAVVTLALEGIGGAFTLADFDQLSLSNLNRLRGGVHDIGIDKTVLAARQLFEIDPWLDVRLHRDGVRADTIDDFLLGGGRLDLVVEECDDLLAKVMVRERARHHRIPVLMDTSDRGLLDVERFDLEPDRPVLHGLVGPVRAEELRGMTTKDKVPIVLAIIDEQRMSTPMAASLPEIETTIGSWPQLASGVALGGALVADTARRMLLGEHTESGRYYVDIGEIIADGRGLLRKPVDPPSPFEVAPEARRPLVLPPEPDREQASRLSVDAVRWVAAVGSLAPSAHNSQPWQLRWCRTDHVLQCRHDPARDLPNLDFEHGATWLAFGAMLENISMAARHLGLDARLYPWPDVSDPHLVCAVELIEDGRAYTDPLLAHVTTRVTNRRRDGRKPLPDAAATTLTRACAAAGTQLQLLDRTEELHEVAALVGAGDRISLLDPNLHHDVTHGYRWSPQEVLAQPHGIDVATLEFTATERAGLRLTHQRRVVDYLRHIGQGRALEDIGRELVDAASAVGLVTIAGTARESFLAAGQAVQRMWLTATASGLALQPITGLPYLFARLERGNGEGLSLEARSELKELRVRFNALFHTQPEFAEAFLFRIAVAGPPTARSLRLPIQDILTVV